MGAKRITGAPGGPRTRLIDVLPLCTPYLIQFFPIYACNFRCEYCFMSTDPDTRGFVSDRIRMNKKLFKKCVNDIKQFPDKIKTIRFVGMGEPLLHSGIVDMVADIRDAEVTDRIEILTNASLLTWSMSNNLCSAGLTHLVVAIQGMGDDKYLKITNTNQSLQKIIDNIAYLHSKQKVHIYVKIVDYVLDSKAEEDRFYRTFENICNAIGVEHAVPIMPGVDYEKIMGKSSVTQFAHPIVDVAVCPQSYFTMQINPDGKVVPCYQIDYPEILGDVNEESLMDIWDKNFRFFQYTMAFGRHKMKICKDCNFIKYRIFPEDNLDSEAGWLKIVYA